MGVKNILAKAIDEDHGKILRRVGAREIIHPERDMASGFTKFFKAKFPGFCASC